MIDKPSLAAYMRMHERKHMYRGAMEARGHHSNRITPHLRRRTGQRG